MKAARIYEYGSPNVFRVEEMEPPKLLPHDVLIEVHATSINPIDYKIRQGGQRGAIRYKMPVTLGMDVSGVVAEVGAQVEHFKVGDEVYSSPSHKRQGTYAEFVAIDADSVTKKPQNMSHIEAASIPLVGLTAWEALIVKGHLQKDQKLFVQAGSGGVGTIAIQIAKAHEVYVATSCSSRNIELVKSLGADRVIDYTKEQFDEQLSGYDHAIEALGQPYQDRTRKILKRGGHLALLNAGLPENTRKHGANLGLLVTGWQILSFKLRTKLFWGIRTSQVLRQTKGELLAELTHLIEQEKIKAVLDQVFPLDEIAQAHAYLETGRARGKVVIAVKE